MTTKEEALEYFIEFLREREVPEEIIGTACAFDGGFGPNTFGITCAETVVVSGSNCDSLSKLVESLECIDRKYDIKQLVTRWFVQQALEN